MISTHFRVRSLHWPLVALLGIAMSTGVTDVAAQTPTTDVSARLTAVLPAPVAQHILAVIAQAQAEHLPSQALENRALKFAARGVEPSNIATSADAQLVRMRTARQTLAQARNTTPTNDEIEAGAEALREGVDGATVSAFAKSAPSGRSLAVPLYVIGTLVNRGLPSDSAARRVLTRLQAKASDADLTTIGNDVAAKHRPAETGPALGASKRSGTTGPGDHPAGPPAGVPGNGGANARPSTLPSAGHKPSTPGKSHP